MKFDFHMHTLDDPLDHHVYHTAHELVDRAAELGYGALAITLHNAQLENRELTEYARKRGIMLLPGIEQDIEGCHVLLINYPKSVSEGIRTFADLAKAKSTEGLVIAPHPYFPGGVSLLERFDANHHLFDAVEVSGFYHRHWNPNRKGMDAASRFGLPLVGNSDTHTLEQFGSTWSEVECDSSPESLIAAIKAGKAVVHGRPLRAVPMAIILWKVIVRGYMKWVNYKRTRGHKPLV
jgi:predicted metal-dependent phosphoesterase TrpH